MWRGTPGVALLGLLWLVSGCLDPEPATETIATGSVTAAVSPTAGVATGISSSPGPPPSPFATATPVPFEPLSRIAGAEMRDPCGANTLLRKPRADFSDYEETSVLLADGSETRLATILGDRYYNTAWCHDIDGDRVPEILIVSAFGTNVPDLWLFQSGATLELRWEEAWLGTFEPQDLDGQGALELVGADGRTKYWGTSGAFSRYPLMVFRYVDGVMRNVSTEFPGLAQADRDRHLAALRSCGQLAKDRRTDCENGAMAAVLGDSIIAGDWDTMRGYPALPAGAWERFNRCAPTFEVLVRSPESSPIRCDPEFAGRVHVVQAGDTCASVASRTGVEGTTIERLNPWLGMRDQPSCAALHPGDILRLE